MPKSGLAAVMSVITFVIAFVGRHVAPPPHDATKTQAPTAAAVACRNVTGPITATTQEYH